MRICRMLKNTFPNTWILHKIYAITLALILISLFLRAKDTATAANREGIYGGRSIEADMAPQYEKLLNEIRINIVKNLPPASGSVSSTAQSLCPDLRARLAELKGANQKLLTVDGRLCERVVGNDCLKPNVWRVRTFLRQQLASACGVPE